MTAILIDLLIDLVFGVTSLCALLVMDTFTTWAVMYLAFQAVYWGILRYKKTEFKFSAKCGMKFSFARLVGISLIFVCLLSLKPYRYDIKRIVLNGLPSEITGIEKQEVEEKPAQPEEPEQAEEPLPESAVETEQTEFHIRMVGDILIHNNILNSCKKEDGSYDFSGIFSDTKELSEKADISILNQETVLGGEEMGYSGYPAFCSPQSLGDAEVNAGYNVILGATNHAMDKGVRGILDEVSYWRRNYPDVNLVGMHDSQEDANRLRIVEVGTTNKIKVAILNYTYGTNGISKPSDMPYLVDYLSEEKVAADLKAAREAADFVIVCPHWGVEYKFEPSNAERQWAKVFADNGADLIIGAHPHVVQPIEWIDGMDGHKTLCYYSVGNFVTGTSRTGNDVWKQLVSGMADVTIARNEDGTVGIKQNDIIPLICHWEGGKYRVIEISKYDENMANLNDIKKQDPTFSLAGMQEFIKQIWAK